MVESQSIFVYLLSKDCILLRSLIHCTRRMSGFEIAGVVLGAFPTILKVLECYREGCEPLEEF